MKAHSSLQKGYYNHPLYQIWHQMLRRCYDPSCKDYIKYGARGIRVSDEWWEIENFIKDMNPRPNGMTLDRIDNDKGYRANNCKWSTCKMQSRNSRRTKLSPERIEEIKKLRDLGHTYRDLGIRYGVDHSAIRYALIGRTWS